MSKKYSNRPDRDGTHRSQFDRNRKKILATREICAICGKPVDKSLKWPHPFSATVDHIIPVNKGGHPSDLANLQLAHWCCNRKKSDKIYESTELAEIAPVLSNRLLPHTLDWMNIRAEGKVTTSPPPAGAEEK